MTTAQPTPDDGDTYSETAGDPGAAEELPTTTGRDPEAGAADRELNEETL